MQVNRRQFLGTSALSGLGLATLALQKKASAEEQTKANQNPNESASKPFLSQNNDSRNSNQGDIRLPLVAAFVGAACILIPAQIQEYRLSRRVKKAFKKADEAEENRAARRSHLRESNIWTNNQSSTC